MGWPRPEFQPFSAATEHEYFGLERLGSIPTGGLSEAKRLNAKERHAVNHTGLDGCNGLIHVV